MSDTGVLEATAMGYAAQSDPQFRLPTLPRFAPGLVVVPAAGGLIVEGGPTRQLLGGGAAADVLGRLIPLLDGTRTLAMLADETGRGLESTHATIALLYASGLLEDAAVDPAIDRIDPDMLSFYGRSIDSTRVNASGAEAVHRLRTARIVVAADERTGELAERIADELTAGGIGEVRLLSDTAASDPAASDPAASGPAASGPAASDPAASGIADATLVVLVGSSPSLTALARAAAAAKVGVHPVRVDGRRMLYGPYIDPSYTVDYEDITVQMDADSTAEGEPGELGFAAALFASDVLALVSRVGAVPSQQTAVRIDLDTLEQERLVAVSSTPDGIPLAYAFEASTAFPPRALAAPKDHQVHYKQSNVALQRDSKRWPSAPTLPMGPRALLRPARGLPDPDATPRADRLTAGIVADIVIRTAGNRDSGTPKDGKVLRWAATGGNLGSVQAYLLVRDVDGLPAGVYGYQRGDDSYAVLPWADPRRPVAGADPDAPAVLVLTGALGRVASKYAAFSWRIVHLDAGVAVAQARLLAAGHGIRASVAPAWDDDAIAELLGIDQDAEPVTAVLSLTTAGTPERSLA